MRWKYKGLLLTLAASCVCVPFLLNAPVTFGEWTKQTVWLWVLDSWHIQAKGSKPRFLLIDDDSGYGVFRLKDICEGLGVKATFAVIPTRLDDTLCSSLRLWQQQGYGIALHGLNHERWSGWSREEVVRDINESERLLSQKGFAVDSSIRYVAPPHGCNTRSIRKAIADKGYRMVTGASLVNPDTTTFQTGRIFITKETDLTAMRRLLNLARERNGFVIFGTHSSDEGEFSVAKTKAVLQMALDLGFEKLKN